MQRTLRQCAMQIRISAASSEGYNAVELAGDLAGQFVGYACMLLGRIAQCHKALTKCHTWLAIKALCCIDRPPLVDAAGLKK
jgi:hypothetical protein